MSQCRFYVSGSAACNGKLFKSQSPVPLNKKETAYHIPDSAIIRQFCKGNPLNCPYNPEGKGLESEKVKKLALEKAYERDQNTPGAPASFGIFLILAVIALFYFIFKN